MFREFAAAQLRRRDDYNRDVTLAWNGVRLYVGLMNTKKLPTLSSQFLGESQVPKRQSYAEMRLQMEVVAGQWGIKSRVLERHG